MNVAATCAAPKGGKLQLPEGEGAQVPPATGAEVGQNYIWLLIQTG